MLTTDGSIWRAIWENWFDIFTGEGTESGVASEEGFFSLPFTPADTTVPIKIPSVNVARTTKVEAKRFFLSFCPKLETCESIKHVLRLTKPNGNYTSPGDAAPIVWGVTREFSLL